MISVTTPSIEGQRIDAYHGIVTGDAVMGTNIFSDWFASIRDIVGGRSGSYEKVLQEAKDEAIREMEERAAHMGANAVIGVRLDISAIGGDSKTLLVVSASGTAVRLG